MGSLIYHIILYCGGDLLTKKQISITIDESLLKKVDSQADKEERNRSNYIEKELKKSFKNNNDD